MTLLKAHCVLWVRRDSLKETENYAEKEEDHQICPPLCARHWDGFKQLPVSYWRSLLCQQLRSHSGHETKASVRTGHRGEIKAEWLLRDTRIASRQRRPGLHLEDEKEFATQADRQRECFCMTVFISDELLPLPPQHIWRLPRTSLGTTQQFLGELRFNWICQAAPNSLRPN